MNIKVLHISTRDNYGAGLAALRLHESLLAQGVDSKMLVKEKYSDCDTVFVAEPGEINADSVPQNFYLRGIYKILLHLGIFLRRMDRYRGFLRKINPWRTVFYTLPVSSYELEKHPLVQEADVIHLHWIQDFVNFESFFLKVNKPIIWTFHDLNPLMGGFHFSGDHDNNYLRFRPLEDEFIKIKKDAIQENTNISVVSLSSVMKEKILQSELFCNKRILDNFNSVNYHMFTCLDKQTVRQIVGLPLGKTIFLFVYKNMNDSRKGLEVAYQALQELHIDNSVFVCLGDGTVPEVKGVELIRFHSVSDSEWLNVVYNSADFLLFPSLEECFPQTTLEAMCCGTPVIMTPVSGSSEQICETTGVCSTDFTVGSFKQAIEKALNHSYNREQIREYVINRFSPEKVAKNYIECYQEILEGSVV